MVNIISKIKTPDNTEYNLKDSYKSGIYTVIGTQTAATGTWTGTLHGVSALYDGLTIMYYLPQAGSGNATLNLTLDDGTTTGAVNCYYSTSRLTTHYGKGCNIVMTYWSAGSIKVDGTATTDNRWIANANYDSNSNDTAYYVRRYYPKIVAGANKIFPYTIIMQNADGRWESIVTSSSTGTSKARNTHGFRLGQLLLMYANATYAENAEIGNTNVWEMHSLFDHRQSFNTANNATYGTVTKKPYYLVGSINNSDGLFYLDATWWTKDLPSTEDGKLYIYLGDAYDYYRMSFAGQHPIYHYVNGIIREFTQDAATVNGLTVQTAVPADAVFTDTTYIGTGVISVNSTTHVISTTAEVNQNAFSNVKVGSTTVAADSKTDTLELVASDNVTLTPDATNDKVTIKATDNKVTQTATTTNANYEILFSETADNTTRTEGTGKTNKLQFNPSTELLTVTKEKIANTAYGVSFDRTTATPKETILKTGIKWVSGTHMPVVHITGYAYGLQAPVEFKIGFYIYNNAIGYCGVTNMGAWSPDVYLFKYTRDSVDYVAIGFAGQCYFLQLQVDVQDEMGKFAKIELANTNWSWEFLTTTGNIPTPDSGVSCIKVPYKADILNPSKVNGHTVATDVPSNAVFTDTQSDWNASSGKAQILNKPTLGTAAAKNVPASGNASTTQVVMGNDSRLSDSRTPTSHTHGNIQNGGTLQTNDVTIANGDKLVITDSSDSSKVARASVSFDGSTTTKALTQKGTFETFAASSHTHGNVQNSGTLQTNDITIATGDKLVVTDSSDSNKIARTSVSFDGSTTTKCLTQKGTWENFTNNSGTVTGTGTSGYLTKWNGTNSITNGPQLGSSTTTYLRNDGTWQTPPNDDTKVTQTTDATSSTNGFLLFSGSNNGSTATEGARKSGFLSYRPSEKIASSTGGWESTQQQSGYINYTLASQNEITTKMAASSAPTNWLTETKLSNGFNDSLVGLYTSSGDHYYSEVCPESIQTMGTICSREGYYSDWVEIWYDSEEGTYTYDTQSELMMNRWCENEEDSSTHEITHTWWYEGGFIDAIYPIGAIFITTVNVNPGTYLYGTTWVAFGAGRTIVGVKSSDTDFDTVEKTGGSKKLQEHTHEQQATFRLKGNPNSAASTVYSPGTAISNTSVTEGSGSYSLALRGVDKSNKGYNFKIEGNTKSTGTGDSQNLQPYITVYMWKRTG